MLETLQAGRGVAALLVLAFHLNGSIFGNPKYFPDRFAEVLVVGEVGVEFFFVLSGFLMFWLHDRRDESGKAGRFLVSRIARIYPFYWIVLAGVVPAYFLSPSFGHGYETSPGALAGSLLLFPTPDMPILPVAWTLQHEMLFYMLFTVFILSRSTGLLIFAIWPVACIAYQFTGHVTFPYDFLFSTHNVLFVIGMLAAHLLKTGQAPQAGLSLLVGVGALVPLSAAYIEFIPWRPWLTIGFGLASALIILGSVSLERAGRLRMSRLLPYLGNASYSIYLLHLPILSASAKLFFLLSLDQVLTRHWSFALLFAVPIACSILAYEWIEKPTLTLTRRLLKGARLRPAPAPLEGPLRP